MLRCTVASLIPLMNSRAYGPRRFDLYRRHERSFRALVDRESYYILRELPEDVLSLFFTPAVGRVLDGQHKRGTWKVKDGERITYDVLAALKRAGALPDVRTGLTHDLHAYVRDRSDFHSLLIKRDFFGGLSAGDEAALARFAGDALRTQAADGSWEATVTGTIVNVSLLLDCGTKKTHPAVRQAVGFLFCNFRDELPGRHTDGPYGFTARHMFSTVDREREFAAAAGLKPEWIPRNVCFSHLAVIQNALALTLLLTLGLESDRRVTQALDNLYAIEHEWGGFCASDIKKPYLNRAKKSGKKRGRADA